MISSSGVMWSHENKQGLLRHMPQAILFDSFGSSEAVGLGASVSAAGAAEETARFAITENNAVFTDAGRRVEPGSGEIGMVAVGGFLPVGYYKDDAKSAATFRVIDGRRWSIPGDFATVNADGTIHLLGRGSVCINTGGEKVFPEEVEEVLKTHPTVRDAVVVGVPDDRFGEAIVGVVEPPTATRPSTPTTLRAHVSGRLAAYKAPRRIVVVDSIGRAANGKVDYKRIKAEATAELAQTMSDVSEAEADRAVRRLLRSFRSVDSYGLVLRDDRHDLRAGRVACRLTGERPIVVLVQIATVRLALHTSQAHRPMRVVADVLAVVAAAVRGRQPVRRRRRAHPAVGLLREQPALLRRPVRHHPPHRLPARGRPGDDARRAQRLSLLGMAFAFAYRFLGEVQASAFFGAQGDGNARRRPVLQLRHADDHRVRQPRAGGQPGPEHGRARGAHRPAVPRHGGGQAGHRVEAARRGPAASHRPQEE